MPYNKEIAAILSEDIGNNPDGNDVSAVGTPEEEGRDPQKIDAQIAQKDQAIATERQLQRMCKESSQGVSALHLSA